MSDLLESIMETTTKHQRETGRYPSYLRIKREHWIALSEDHHNHTNALVLYKEYAPPPRMFMGMEVSFYEGQEASNQFLQHEVW